MYVLSFASGKRKLIVVRSTADSDTHSRKAMCSRAHTNACSVYDGNVIYSLLAMHVTYLFSAAKIIVSNLCVRMISILVLHIFTSHFQDKMFVFFVFILHVGMRVRACVQLHTCPQATHVVEVFIVSHRLGNGKS